MPESEDQGHNQLDAINCSQPPSCERGQDPLHRPNDQPEKVKTKKSLQKLSNCREVLVYIS